MRVLVTLVAAFTLLVPSLIRPVFGHAKTLPPAFSKESTPTKDSAEGDDPTASDGDDKPERPDRPVVQPRRQGARGQKLHIQLDGDEDGGGVESDDEDGGEF